LISNNFNLYVLLESWIVDVDVVVPVVVPVVVLQVIVVVEAHLVEAHLVEAHLVEAHLVEVAVAVVAGVGPADRSRQPKQRWSCTPIILG